MGDRTALYRGPVLLWAGFLVAGVVVTVFAARTTVQWILAGAVGVAAVLGMVGAVGPRVRWVGWWPDRSVRPPKVFRGTMVAMVGWWGCAMVLAGGSSQNRGLWVAGGLLGMALSVPANLWWDRIARRSTDRVERAIPAGRPGVRGRRRPP